MTDPYGPSGEFYSEPRTARSAATSTRLAHAVLLYVFAAFLIVAALLVVVVARGR